MKNKVKQRLGEERYNKQGCLMKIVEYKDRANIIVEFQDEYKARVHTQYGNFEKGLVKNPYGQQILNDIGVKICSKCGIEKPLSEFTYRKKEERYVSYCKQCANEKSKEYVQKKKDSIDIKKFVYKLMDKDFNVLYVGKTWDLKRRTYQHINSNSSFFTEEEIKKIEYVGYLLLNSEIQGDLREIYYINKYRPPFNKQYNYEYEDNDIGITMRELEWRIFNIKDLKDIKIDEIETSENVINIYINSHKLTGREVIQINKDTDEPILVFPSGTSASKATGIDDGTIYKVLTKQRPYAGGYKWIKLSEWKEINN